VIVLEGYGLAAACLNDRFLRRIAARISPLPRRRIFCERAQRNCCASGLGSNRTLAAIGVKVRSGRSVQVPVHSDVVLSSQKKFGVLRSRAAKVHPRRFELDHFLMGQKCRQKQF